MLDVPLQLVTCKVPSVSVAKVKIRNNKRFILFISLSI